MADKTKDGKVAKEAEMKATSDGSADGKAKALGMAL